MKKILALLATVTILGAAFFLSGFLNKGKEGVRVHSVKDLSKKAGLGSGGCAAKLDNTNDYSVKVEYRFKGAKTYNTTLNSSASNVPIFGADCSKPNVELISVERNPE